MSSVSEKPEPLVFQGKRDFVIYKGRRLNLETPTAISSDYLGWDLTAGGNVLIQECHLENIDGATSNLNPGDLKKELLRYIDFDHPNLVSILGFTREPENKQVSILTEYIEGQTLRTLLAQKQHLSLKHVREYAVQILKALEYLQSNGIHHSCLSLDTVWINNENILKVSNFYLKTVIANEESNLEQNKTIEYGTTDDISQLGHMLLVSFTGNWEGLDFSVIPSKFKMFLLECNSKSSTAEQLLEHAFIKHTDSQVIDRLIHTDSTVRRDMSMISTGEFEDLKEECTSAVQEELVEDEGSGEDDEDDQEQSLNEFVVSFANCNNDLTVDKCSRLETDFEILELLGKGGCGRIIKVQNRIDRGYYAIKIISLSSNKTESSDCSAMYSSVRTNDSASQKSKNVLSEQQQISMMENKIKSEVQLLSKLNHENVVRYFGTWIEKCEKDIELTIDESQTVKFGKENMFIQMELCEKKTLRNSIDDKLFENIDLVWKLFREIICGLAHIHKFGIIHRDLKPENIFLDSECRVKIGDFGLARGLNVEIFGPEETIEGRVESSDNMTTGIGTSHYVSPEVKSNNKYDQKADIYSLGVIFFEMCYRPISTNTVTGLERDKIMSSLCQQDITLPADFNSADVASNQADLIKLLLNHNPLSRPTAVELLKHDNIPLKDDETELSGSLLRKICQTNSPVVYREVMMMMMMN